VVYKNLGQFEAVWEDKERHGQFSRRASSQGKGALERFWADGPLGTTRA